MEKTIECTDKLIEIMNSYDLTDIEQLGICELLKCAIANTLIFPEEETE